MLVGDLVKYKLKARYHGKEEEVIYKGVWLVVAVEETEKFGELLILKQGNEQRVAHPEHLDKISSSR